ncbi:hypothetical protein AX16_009769, partial [Volvariella volvacea WC 439]
QQHVGNQTYVLTPLLPETEEYPVYFDTYHYKGKLVWVKDMNQDPEEQFSMDN